ncbi:hypothetical protein [Pseudodesulfovibrio senegalensis]|jgi:hypothetical protein|uniref:FlgO domain-containing protein n=1 Tax=Pseudodesulfovibrio senegalensis TaxID=1721087 RepID=A0A6N6N1E9_9BACT|nr:hypothetical protein [Pseudodesulfovibrio senegalensis]KAB1440319.1 hypothetical protein F8A88_13800 [Pseudodesulfovibrio senegalensis]
MNVRMSMLICLLAATLASGGCSVFNSAKEGVGDMFDANPKSGPIATENNTPIIDLNCDAADSLYYYTGRESELPEGSPIYVRNFTNEVDPDDTSHFGRIVANQVAGRLAQHEMLITDGPPPAQGLDHNATSVDGEPLPPEEQPRAAMLIGSYFIGDTVIYMHAKLIRLDDNAVVSGKSWTLPVNDNTRELLPQLKRHGIGLKPSVQDTF